MSTKQSAPKRQSSRDELLELSRALILTTISSGIVPQTPQAARDFVRMAREVVSEVERATVAPATKQQSSRRVPIDSDGDGDSGADMSGLEDLGV